MIRVMIVDDEEWAVKRIRRILAANSEIGEVVAFLNPRDAYEYAKEQPVDVAFLDISMPDVNGMKLSRLLQEVRGGIDIVFVTGSDEHAVKAYEMSALDYVMKPVTAERLASTMEKIRRVRREPSAGDPFGGPAGERTLEVRLFNGLGIRLRDAGGTYESVKLRSPKTEELFAYLVCKRSAGREEIAETLWGGLPPVKAWKNLNSTLYYIRKAIPASKGASRIETIGNEIRWIADGLYCDLYEFERIGKEIRRDPDKNAALFEQADALYAGPLLHGKPYDWVGEYAREIEGLHIELLELEARYDLRRGQPLRALRGYGEILKLDAMREDIHKEAIGLLLQLGRKPEAVRQYRELEEMLLRELGSRPDPAILEMLS